MFYGDLVSELHIEDAATTGFKTFLKRYSSKVDDPNLFVNFTAAETGGDKRFYGQNRPPRMLPKDPMPHAAGPAFLMATPNHSDPIGMYGYPLEYVVKHPFDVVYGSEGKTLRVVRRTEGCRTLDLQRATLQDLQKVLDYLKIPASSGNFIEWWKKHGSVAYRKPTPGHMIWHLIQHDYSFKGVSSGKDFTTLNWRRVGNSESYAGMATIGQDEYTANVNVTKTGISYAMIKASAGKGGYKQIIPKTDIEIDPTDQGYNFNLRAAVTATLNRIDKVFTEQRDQGDKSAPSLDTLQFSKEAKSGYDQRMMINKLGWDALQDTASDDEHAIIYHGEPEQAVFVNKKGFEIEDEFKLNGEGSEKGIAPSNLDDHRNRMNSYARKIATQLGDKIIERSRSPEGVGTANCLGAVYTVLKNGNTNAALAAMDIEQMGESSLRRFFMGRGTNSTSRFYRTQKGWLHIIILSGGDRGKAGHRYRENTNADGIAYEYMTKDKFEPATGFYTTSKIGDVVKDQHGSESRHLTWGDARIDMDEDAIGEAATKASLLVRCSDRLRSHTKKADLSDAFGEYRKVNQLLKEAADILGYPSLKVDEKSINDILANGEWFRRIMKNFEVSDAAESLSRSTESTIKSSDEYYNEPISEELQQSLRDILKEAANGEGMGSAFDSEHGFKQMVGEGMNKWVPIAQNYPVKVDEEMHKIFDLCLHLFVIAPIRCSLVSDGGIVDSVEAVIKDLRELKKKYPDMKVDPFRKATTPSAETEAGGSAGESSPMQSSTPGESTPS